MRVELYPKAHIPGVIQFKYFSSRDARGEFKKPYQSEALRTIGIQDHFTEDFYSWSNAGVFRGFHFQKPPAAHAKLVYCLQGKVDDYVLDLRVGSPTYGQIEMFVLNSDESNAVYLPVGLAHGFHVPAGNALVGYKVSASYHPDCDQGIAVTDVLPQLSSRQLIMSDRDRTFPRLKDFVSPFSFEGPVG